MIKNNNFNLSANPQVSNNLDVRVKHEHDRKRGYPDDQKEVQYGRSMIEMLGVLAIVGVLSVGGIAGYSKAMEKFKINKIVNNVSHVAANIQTLYAQQSSYGGLGGGIFCYNCNNIIGIDLKEGGNFNPYGDYRIHTGENHFEIAFNELPVDVCAKLASMDWGNKSSGLTAIYIGWWDMDVEHILTKQCSPGDCVFKGKDLPLSVSDAYYHCEELRGSIAGGKDPKVMLTWIFE